MCQKLKEVRSHNSLAYMQTNRQIENNNMRKTTDGEIESLHFWLSCTPAQQEEKAINQSIRGEEKTGDTGVLFWVEEEEEEKQSHTIDQKIVQRVGWGARSLPLGEKISSHLSVELAIIHDAPHNSSSGCCCCCCC